MSIKITWNRTKAGNNVSIMRSEDPITEVNPGTTLATVDGSTSMYEDKTALYGVTYYYQVVNDIGTEVMKSASKKVFADVDTGPGPKTLIWGNAHLGYYGTVPEAELAVSTNTWRQSSLPVADLFHKFIRGGKIFYAALIIGLATPTVLLQRGVFNAGIRPFNSGSTPSNPIVTLDGRRYAQRIAKYFDTENTDTVPNNYKLAVSDNAPFLKSEFLDFYRMFFENATGVMTSPFSIQRQTGYVSGSAPFLTCDFGNTAMSTIYGFTSQPQMQTLGMGLNNNIGMGTGSGVGFAVVEYLGV